MIRAFAALLVLALLALPLRDILAHPTSLSVLPSLQVDAAAYDAIAADVARTKSLSAIPPLQPPGFVVTVAAVFAVMGHSWVAAKLFLWLVFVACVAMTARLAWRLYGNELHAWTAAVMTGGAPALHGYVGTIQYEVIAAAWLLLLISVASRSGVHSVANCAVIGLLAGVAVLTREVFVSVVPVLAIYVAHREWRARASKRAITCALAVVVCAGLPVAGWAMQQTGRIGRVVAISDKGPLVMAFGNNPRANGTFNAPLVGVGQPSGLEFVRAEPFRFVQLAGRKFLYFWGVLRDGWNVPRPSALWVARSLGGAVPLEWLLPLARGGWILVALVMTLVWWRRPTWQQWWVLPIAIVAIMSMHLLTVSSHRFALPVLPIAFALISGPFSALARAMTSSTLRRAVCVAVLVAIVGMQQGEWPIKYTLSTAALDGRDAENIHDPDLGLVRFARADRGPRAVGLLTDEALPRGTFDVAVRVRAARRAADQAVGHVWLQTIDGTRVCETAVDSSRFKIDDWADVTLQCTLEKDTVATLVVTTTGVADLALGSLALRW